MFVLFLQEGFYCTIMELKVGQPPKVKQLDFGFNCTIAELK